MTATSDLIAAIHAGECCGANLSGAYLSGTNLRGTNLCGADLSEAYLRWADLRWAHLREANLRGTNLREANLSGADLCGAHLSGAYLSGTNLCGADLCGTNLSGAYLCGTDLSEAIWHNTRLHNDGVWSGAPRRLSVGGLDALVLTPEIVRIGCKALSIDEWLGVRGAELADKHSISQFDRETFRAWLERLAELDEWPGWRNDRAPECDEAE